MNLTKLFETQKVLRDRIDYNKPDRFDKLVTALLVEIGECANEQRECFKFWKQDNSPVTKRARTPYLDLEDAEFYNPLLEEYVDGLHFVLDIGLEMNYTISPYETSYEENLTQQFRTVYYRASCLTQFDYNGYEYLVSYYLGLGEMLGFTWSEIEDYYFIKNEINHIRQATGY